MKARITSSVALFLALGLNSSVFAASPVSEDEFMLAANDTAEAADAVEATDTADTVEAADAVDGDALPDEVNMEELMAEIRVACQEAAEDEQIPAENRDAFTEECVAENMAVDAPDDSMAADEGIVSDQALPDEAMAIEEDTLTAEEIIPDDAEMVDGAPEVQQN